MCSSGRGNEKRGHLNEGGLGFCPINIQPGYNQLEVENEGGGM